MIELFYWGIFGNIFEGFLGGVFKGQIAVVERDLFFPLFLGFSPATPVEGGLLLAPVEGETFDDSSSPYS